ncbi:MAG: hypothetical protein F6K63_23865 [Moorea sp. SIO1G6]|nr:hypothetical protein [Moorena sp. SIO1G6]NET67257.1 hypothetical protein [Moorena sp. SIO1G6]
MGNKTPDIFPILPLASCLLPLASCLLPLAFFSNLCVYNRDTKAIVDRA